jgi:probable rRNA maturation factor
VFKLLLKKILRKEKSKGPVDITLMSDDEIRRINLKFRGKDKPTDVLAFPYPEENILGEVLISRESARRNAKRFGVTYTDELKRLTVHGILHVLGYDHGRKMKSAEKIYQKL